MAERRPLGLRIGEPVSPVGERKELKYVLQQVAERRPISIDGIQADIKGAVGGEFPLEFLVNSGMIDLAWQHIYHPRALSQIYLGSKVESQTPLPFHQADAIIAVHSNIPDGKVNAMNIEVATVIPDSNGRKRVLNASYYGYSTMVKSAYVSISDAEKPVLPPYLHPDFQEEEERRLQEIPSRIDHPIFLPVALVSEKMSKLAQGDTKMVSTHRVGGDYLTMFTGYFDDHKDTERILGKGDRRNPEWYVTYPLYLEEAA